MPRPPSQLRHNLKHSAIDGTSYSVMVGLAENQFPAFILAIGATQVASGLIATVPICLCAFLQLLTPWGVRKFGSYRAWVVSNAYLQAAALIPLVVCAWLGRVPTWLVFAAATLYWFGSVSGGPAWTTWKCLIFPERLRARYFARRSRWCNAGVLLGLLLGGLFIERIQDATNANSLAVLRAFAVVFAIAAVARIISGTEMLRISEPRPLDMDERDVSWREFASKALHSFDGRFILFAGATAIAAQIAQPFFNPYVLKQVGLESARHLHAALLAAAFAGRMAVLPIAGRIAHRQGPLRLAWLSAVALVPLAPLWALSDNIGVLFAVQLLVGGMWGAFELASLLMFFDALHPRERTSILTKWNLVNYACMTAGSLIGGQILAALGENRRTYLIVFAFSSLARFLALGLLVRARQPSDLHEEPTLTQRDAALPP